MIRDSRNTSVHGQPEETANIIIGTNGSMGGLDADHVPEPALLEDRGDDAVCRSDRQEFITTAWSGTSRDRNTSISSRKERPSTTPMKRGKRAVRYSEKPTVAATAPGDATVPAPYPVSRSAGPRRGGDTRGRWSIHPAGRSLGRATTLPGVSGSFGTAGVRRLFPRLRPALGSPLRGPLDPSRDLVLSSSGPARSEAGGQHHALRVVVSSG